MNHMMMAEASKKLRAKKTQREWEKAVAEDATVFQYDEVYDGMEKDKVGGRALPCAPRSGSSG